MKKCSKCNIFKSLDNFSKRKASKDGLSYLCKQCKKIIDRENQIKNKEKIKKRQAEYYLDNKEKIKKRSLEYYENNKEEISIYYKNYYKNNNSSLLDKANLYYKNNKKDVLKKSRNRYKKNTDKYKERSKVNYINNIEQCKNYNKKYKEENKEYFKKYKSEYYNSNKEYFRKYNKKYKEENREKLNIYWKNFWKRNKHKKAWRSILYRYLKLIKMDKTDSTYNLLGYSSLELKKRIECQFKPGMSWENYGEWHIDHKKAIFKFRENSSPRIVNMLSNLQPLWAEENLIKGKK